MDSAYYRGMPDREHSGAVRESPGLFATTHWSLVLAVGDHSGGADVAAAALAKLCQAYWYPVYAHVRRRGYGAEDARDLTQEFFAQLLRENTVAAADPTRGRFRSFLLGVLKRFLAHAEVRAAAQKRGGGVSVVSWEQAAAEERIAQEPRDEDSPDRLFDRRWALSVIAAATTRLRTEQAAFGRANWFDTLQPYLTAEADAPSYAASAARLGISNEAVKSAIHRLRQRYFAALRAEVAQTVGTAEELEDELRHLRAAVSEGPPPA